MKVLTASPTGEADARALGNFYKLGASFEETQAMYASAEFQKAHAKVYPTQATELRNKLAAINADALGSMLTELVTRNGQTALKCYTLNRANAEAIAEGGLILELYDGYLILPAPQPTKD